MKQATSNRIKALLEFKAPDRVPVLSFASGYVARICGMGPKTFFTCPEKSLEVQLVALNLHGWDDSPGFGWADWGGGIFGGDTVFPETYEQAAPWTCRFPVTSAKAAESARARPPKDTPMFGLLHRFNKAAVEKGCSPKLRAGSVTSLVYAAIGMDRFMDWLAARQSALGVLFEKSADFLIRAAKEMVDNFGPGLGAGISAPFESLMNPDAFQRLAAPAQSRVNRELMALGIRSFFLHLCGDHSHILGDWARLPWPDRMIVSAGDQMDLEKVARAFGHKHVVAGNVPTTTIAMGSFSHVLSASLDCLGKWADLPGGFVLMPACDLPVLAPPGTVHGLVAASRQHHFHKT